MPIQKQREFQNLVTTLAREFINLPLSHVEEGIHDMLGKVGQFIGADRAYIYHFTENATIANMVYEWCSPNTARDIETEQAIPTAPFSDAFERFRQGEPDFIAEVSQMPDERQIEREKLAARGIQSRITIPLFVHDELFGSMGFHAIHQAPDWAGYTVDVLKIVAEIYINVLHRKAVERQMLYQAELLQNVTDAIFSTDVHLVITSWNRACEEIYGYTAEQAIGRTIAEVLKTDYVETSRSEIIKHFIEHHQWEGEVIRYSKDGDPIDILLSVSAILGSNGELQGGVFVNRDISKRKAFEAQQLELALQSERIQILERIISDLSHDIKTPLTNIQLQLYMLGRHKDPTKHEKFIEKMSWHITRLTRLVDDILIMSRLDNSEDLKFEPINLQVMFDDLNTNYSDLAQQKQQALQFNIALGIPNIYGNPVELSRALSNLIENAINYTPEGKTIDIDAFEDEADIVITIEDQGIGIDPRRC